MKTTAPESEFQHPAVDWAITSRASGRLAIQVTCPWCHSPRLEDAAQVRYRIRRGSFTGFCYKDRLVNHPRRGKERLPHPTVHWDDSTLNVLPNGQRRMQVPVTCPVCHKVRHLQQAQIADKVRRGHFSGECLTCSKNAPKREWLELSPGRKLDPIKGYIRVSPIALRDGDRALFDAMRGRMAFVTEHRLVMARELGRPLTSHELVDHMDGNKTNNEPSNLRLYHRGKNEPGDTSGYGTFYHEWQMALSRIAALEHALSHHVSN
jgi:hypothetical protein